MSPGEKRRRQLKRERDRAARDEKLSELRGRGASCATCAHFEYVASIGMTCDLGSDFYGYQKARASGLCTQWSERDDHAAPPPLAPEGDQR